MTFLRPRGRSSRSSRSATKKKTMKKPCPTGYLLRKGYTRKFSSRTKDRGYTVKRGDTVYRVYPKTGAVQVKPTCVKDRGLPGTITGPGIGPLKRGELIKFGYSYRLPSDLRRTALKKAISEYTALSVYRKLDAVAKLSLRTNPKASRKFAADRDWIKDNYSGVEGLKEGI
jgi:hypothetical protein